MNRHFISILSNAITLIVFSFALHTGVVAGEKQKSVVLKDRSAEYNVWYLRRDNAAEELWNAFQLVRNANSGDAAAEHELGLRYLLGKGFTPDTEKAVYWIRKAAEQNYVIARYNLGILLNNGLSVLWNPFEAYKNLQYAANHGMVEAEYIFGLLHTDNLVVSRNYPEAYHWLKMAADSGYAPANDALTEFRNRGINVTAVDTQKNFPSNDAKDIDSNNISPVFVNFSADTLQFPDNKKLLGEALLEANAQFKIALNNVMTDTTGTSIDSAHLQPILEAGEAGNPEALTLIGFWYERGWGVKQNKELAAMYYLRAIRFDSPWSPMLLWRMIQDKKFFIALKKHIDSNKPEAKFIWAELVKFGFDNQLLDRQAIDFLTQSAEQEYIQAMVELGICNYNGSWVEQNRENALKLFHRAAALGSREAQLRISAIEYVAQKNTAPDSILLKNVLRYADEGSVLAQEMLGYFYQVGVGVPKNKIESVKFYRKAAQRGSRIAYNALKFLYNEIRPKEKEFRVSE